MFGNMCRGDRIEVYGFHGYDLTKSVQFLGQSFMKDAFVRINTENTVNGWTGWPYSGTTYWESWPVKVGWWLRYLGVAMQTVAIMPCTACDSLMSMVFTYHALMGIQAWCEPQPACACITASLLLGGLV